MKCDRLISLVKNWYLKVQEEAMAPARMVAFMEKHVSQCEECLADPDVTQEVDKIREIVLPPSKVPKPKAARATKEEVVGEDAAVKEEVAGEEDVEEDTDSDGENTEDEGEDVDTEGDLGDDDDPEPDEIDDDAI